VFISMSKVRSPRRAQESANADAIVDLPTPPFPEKSTKRLEYKLTSFNDLTLVARGEWRGI